MDKIIAVSEFIKWDLVECLGIAIESIAFNATERERLIRARFENVKRFNWGKQLGAR